MGTRRICAAQGREIRLSGRSQRAAWSRKRTPSLYGGSVIGCGAVGAGGVWVRRDSRGGWGGLHHGHGDPGGGADQLSDDDGDQPLLLGLLAVGFVMFLGWRAKRGFELGEP